MVKERFGTKGLFVLITLICLTPQLFSQVDSLLSVKDTSYFRQGDDSWNLVESVIRKKHGNVLLLLKRGADPDAKAEGGMTALMFAAESGDSILVQLLVLNGADPELGPVESTTPLIVAVLNGHFTAAHILLEKGADPDHRDDMKGSALLYAAALNDYRIADLLIFYGAADTIRDGDGNDPLLTAVYFGNLETADVLLQNGLDPNVRDKQGNTPLMIASQQGNRDMLNLLLEYGADMDAVNSKNYSALAHAIRTHQDDAARILVDSGAHIHHKVSGNRNLYDLAVEEDRKQIRKLLKERGAAPFPRPDLSEIDIAWGNSFHSSDHFMQARISWVDRKFGYFAETGFDIRPIPLKVQVAANDSTLFQYRENRPSWAHGLGRYIRVIRDNSGMEYGFYGSVSGLLSFPRYRGIDTRPAVRYTPIPSAGLYLRGRPAGMKAGVERYSFGTLHESPWKFNITIFLRIPYDQTAYEYKEIQY
jgi:ankyrin repeat protein